VAAAAAATAPARATRDGSAGTVPRQGDCPDTPRLFPAARSQLAIGVLRLALGAAGFAAARIAGADSSPALLAFALGAFGFLVSMGSAGRFAGTTDAAPAPAHEQEAMLRTLLAAAWPSTAGVAVLLAISVAIDPRVAALLAGVEAGMGAAALLSAARIRARERALGGQLLIDRRTRRLYLQ
jgi:hypothetical protein